MDSAPNSKLQQLPDEMFNIIKSTSTTLAPRLGRLSLPGRRVINTPHYLGNTSRGVVPHITPDTFRRDCDIGAVYVGLEDFIERYPKQTPPIAKFQALNDASRIRKFTALPDETVLVVGARRLPTIAPPPASSNTDTTISVCTSVGFKALEVEDYADIVETLGADIVVALGDVPYGRTLGGKRIEKATDRNIQWLKEHVVSREEGKRGRLFASMLPVECKKQQYFVECLTEELNGKIDGLAVFDVDTMLDLPDELAPLPRLGFTTPESPHGVLRQINIGMDLFIIPFIGAATDAGIALDFDFPVISPLINGSEPKALGVDMWSTAHAVDLSPLAKDCQCYACTNHHRAYLQHLLMAKEMLGWVLLQTHNHHIMDLFFDGIRQSLARDTFEEDVRIFERTYEPQLPAKTGQGPRVRGYQFKSEGPGEAKKNAAPFSTLNDGREKLAEATPPVADAGADELEERGFAEKTSS